MAKVVDIVIDYETLNSQDHCINESAVLELGAVAFTHDPESGDVPDFTDMITNGFRVKFDLMSQKGKRVMHKDTLAWWKKQTGDAQKVLIPSKIDVSVEDGHRQFADWIAEQGLTWNSQIWCRGNSFDLPILSNCLHQAGITEHKVPAFWKQRETRTRIEAMLGRGKTECPLPLGSLPGFIHHNGIHDCAKDVMMLTYAYRYAFGMEELPSEENTEPCTLPKKRK